MSADEHDTEMGALLRALREQRGLSVKRLAAMAKVARKTVDNAEAGLNVSVAILKKLLRAMDVAGLVVRPRGGHAVFEESSRISPAEALKVSESLHAAAVLLENLSERMGAGETRIAADVGLRAEALIASFSSFVRSVEDPGELDRLQDSVADLYSAERPAQRRRRTTTRRQRA